MTEPPTTAVRERRTTMNAMLLQEFGRDLALTELAMPQPGRGEVLVRVAASGVNPLDTKIRTGGADHAQVVVPAVLGIDLAGTVVELGPGTGQRFDIGDEVYGMTGGVGPHQGSLAEYAAVDVDLLAPKPSRLSMVEAAALPLSVITAWEGLVDRAEVTAGDLVLVHGGGGGVGSIAVQLAQARGALVFATEVGAGLEIVRDLGAEPIDALTATVAEYVASATGGKGFDIIFDTRGGTTLDDSFASVREHTGHVVSILGWGSHSLAPLSFRGATYSGIFTLMPLLTGRDRAHHGEILRAAGELVDRGQLLPRLASERYDWSTVMNAHRAVETGSTGKIVIDLSGPPLPPVVARYLVAHGHHDPAAAATAFTQTATVRDIDQAFIGTKEIAEWLRESSAEYQFTMRPVSSSTDADGVLVVQNHLEGNFPGGEVDLDYRFTLSGDLISSLDITPTPPGPAPR